ncbi:MAG: hypothetical protein ACFFBD_18240, partial [Candidatus Hodarchaeota archaeon]
YWAHPFLKHLLYTFAIAQVNVIKLNFGGDFTPPQIFSAKLTDSSLHGLSGGLTWEDPES